MSGLAALERALREGDLGAARSAIGDPSGFPNVSDPFTNTPILALALSWSPFETVEQLLADGADPNFEALDGFPALLGVVLSDREDAPALLGLLIRAGADVEQRGLNDWTPLHAAASRDDSETIELLLQAGADPSQRTRIHDRETPLEEAMRAWQRSRGGCLGGGGRASRLGAIRRAGSGCA